MWLPDRFKRRFSGRMGRGDSQGAAALARKYAKAFPEDETGWALGQAARRAGDLEGAEEAFRQARAVAPTPWNEYNLSRVLASEDKTMDARTILESLVTSETTIDQFYGHLGLFSVDTKEHRWDAARAHGRAAEQLIPADRPRWSAELGSIAADIPAENDWAERLLREGARTGEARVYVLLALAVDDRHPEEARTLLHQARDTWPGDPGELDRVLPDPRLDTSADRAMA